MCDCDLRGSLRLPLTGVLYVVLLQLHLDCLLDEFPSNFLLMNISTFQKVKKRLQQLN